MDCHFPFPRSSSSVPKAALVLGLVTVATDRRREQRGQRWSVWKTELLTLMIMPRRLGGHHLKLIPGIRSKTALSAGLGKQTCALRGEGTQTLSPALVGHVFIYVLWWSQLWDVTVSFASKIWSWAKKLLWSASIGNWAWAQSMSSPRKVPHTQWLRALLEAALGPQWTR